MTTEQLRKEITVNYYHITNAGIYVVYFYALKNEIRYLHLNPEECARQLSAIGSIDSWESQPFRIFSSEWGDDPQDWITFAKTFKLSQWEALTLAIRHEYEKELEKDANLLEIDTAIEALKNI